MPGKAFVSALIALLLLSWLPSPASATHTLYHDSWNDGYWAMEYDVPQGSTDGLIILNAKYLGVRHVMKMSLPQIMVEQEQRNISGNNMGSAPVYVQQLEFGKATGYPVVTDLYNPAVDLTGFAVTQEFNIIGAGYSYRYIQRYDFWQNGEFFPLLEIYGPGHDNYWSSKYHAFWRIDFDMNDTYYGDSFDFYSIQNWQLAWAEHDYHDDKVYEYGRHEWQNRDSTGKGFISRPWVSGNAWPTYRAMTWALQYENGEGNLDLGQQNLLDFPGHNWDNDGGVQNTDLVNWFVASGYKLHADNVMRFLGVQFIPVGLP
ncbi:MAG: hypothetical protein HY671_10715 [Chloroflexi bacterium]|nr:hypothetical protein [Chloroflexota bacterium]